MKYAQTGTSHEKQNLTTSTLRVPSRPSRLDTSTRVDPLDAVRESRVRLSRECKNDPVQLVRTLRERDAKYRLEVDRYRDSHRRVAESSSAYGTSRT